MVKVIFGDLAPFLSFNKSIAFYFWLLRLFDDGGDGGGT